MKELKKAQMGMIAILTVMLVSIKRRLPVARKLSSGITTLALAGIVLLVAAGGASAADCSDAIGGPGSCNCGDTVVGDYTFDANMVCPCPVGAEAPGLYVGASGITINGAGYKMTGTRGAACCSKGILWGGAAPPSDNNPAMHSGIANIGDWNDVEITDLEIEEFCTGIALGSMVTTNVDFNKVTNCSIHDCGDPGSATQGIHMVQTNYSSVKCNSIHDIEGSHLAGCSGGGNGIFMYGNMATYDGWHNSFTCNDLSDNVKSGFFMKHQCMHNYLGNNYAVRNGEGGIVPMCMRSHYNTIDRNNLSYNGKWGFMTRGTGNNIINNTIIGNGAGSMGPGAGISIVASATPETNVVDDNCVCGNLGTDINIDATCICNDNTCDVINGGTGSLCPWNCDDPTSVYYDFDEDASYSGLFGTCSNLLQVGAGNNPGLFDTAGASTHCDGGFCIYPDPGDDPNDCDPGAPAEPPYYCDVDEDGYFSAAPTGTGAEVPPDCQPEPGDDCDDTDAAINPGAAENCTDGIDNDCDGLIDGADPDCFPNKVYFAPSDIRVPKYCDTETVGVWINSSDSLGSGTIIFDYASCCANVTDFAKDPVSFPGLSGEFFAATLTPGRVKIDFATGLLDGFPANIPVRLGNMTIHCCNPSDFCVTDLTWNCTGAILQNGSDVAITPVNYEDGTFMCNIPDLEVTEILPVAINDTHYTVDCTIKNTGEANASASSANLTVDGSQVDTMSVPELAPGQAFTGSFTPVIALSSGSDDLMVCADYDDTVVELSETNNCEDTPYPAGVEMAIEFSPVHNITVAPGDEFIVNVTVAPRPGVAVYGVEYTLSFTPGVIFAEWQNEGDFLKQGGANTNVYIGEIDNVAGTLRFGVTRIDTQDGATDKGVLARIGFTALEQQGVCTGLNFTLVKVSDPGAAKIEPVDLVNGSVCTTDNKRPVSVPESTFTYNNVGEIYISKAYFDGSASYDPDGGSITRYSWAFGDGQYGTGETIDHIYDMWKWNTTAHCYDQFVVGLTVEDDGTPILDNTTEILVNVYIAGDANGDGEVDIFDATIVGLEWDEECTSGSWATGRKDQADLNNDCIVDIFDAVIVGANWDHTAWV